MSFIEKKYIYKVFNNSGDYVGTLDTRDIISNIAYTTSINGGPGQAKIALARKAQSFGEGTEIALNYRIKVYCFDRDTGFEGSEVLIYDGYISGYSINKGEYNDTVEVTLLGWMSELNRCLLRNGNDTEVVYSATDPSNIFKNALDKFTALGGIVDYDSTSVDLCGYTEDYTFNTSMTLEVLNKCLELSPTDFYWTVYPDNIAYFKKVAIAPQFYLRIGGNVKIISVEKRVENIINRVYFTGGGSPPLYKKYERLDSIAKWGLYETTKIDERVTIAATAKRMSDRIIDANEQPEIRVVVTVFDNNGNDDGMGIDLESLRVGQVIRVSGFDNSGYTNWDSAIWDRDYWDYDITNVTATNLIIVKIDYSPNSATLEMTTRLPNIARRVEEIAKDLKNLQTANNPTIPS